MIREEDMEKVEELVREYGAEYRSWKVIPNEQEMKQLKL